MTVTITGAINDVTARKDSRPWRVWSPVYRQGPNGEIVTVTVQTVKVVAGAVTIKLEPGPAVIENPDGEQYLVTIPDTDANLWDVIEAAVAIPPDTALDQLDAAMERFVTNNPDFREAIGAADTASVVTAQATADAAQAASDLLADLTNRGYVVCTNNNYAAIAQSAISYATPNTFEVPRLVGIPVFGIRVVYANWTIKTSGAGTIVDIDPATTATFSAAIRTAADNQVYALTFSGKRQAVADSGAVIVSDMLPIQLAKGDTIYPRTYGASGSGIWSGVALGNVNSGLGGAVNSSDLTATDSGLITATAANGWAPIAILGMPIDNTKLPRSWLIQGASISYGATDGIYCSSPIGYYAAVDRWAGGGFLMRALSGEAGVICTAQGGDRFMWFNAGKGHFRRQSMVPYARHCIVGEPTNDFSAGQTLAQAQASILLAATRNKVLGAARNVTWTIPPFTTSTDSWATLGNQTVVLGSNPRVQYNDWLRDGLPIDKTTLAAVATGTSTNVLRAGDVGHPFHGYVEVADVVESARNSGKWKLPALVANDAAITSGSQNMSSASSTFTSAHLGMDVIIAGAGAGGAAYVGTIDQVVDAHTIKVVPQFNSGSAGTTVTGARAVIGPPSRDGVHPSTNGNKDIAAAIKSSLLALAS